MSGRLYISTFGCQMNEYDSARMADVLRESAGLELTSQPEEADVVLLNTCSVREKAQEKVFSHLGQWRLLKREQARPRHRRRRLRREPGGRGHPRARAVRRPRVRAADHPSPAGDDRGAARDARAAGGHLLPGDREVRPPARAARRGRDGIRLDHGRLQPLLQLLRRALHARRGDEPPVRRRSSPRSPRSSRRACARSPCSGRT